MRSEMTAAPNSTRPSPRQIQATRLGVSGRTWRTFPHMAILSCAEKASGCTLRAELLDHVHQSGRRPLDLFADVEDVARLDSIEIAPHRPRAEIGKLVRGCSEMVFGEHDVVRLSAHNFFNTQMRPVLIADDRGFGARPAQRVRNKCLLPDRLQRVEPHDEKNVYHRAVAQPRVQRVEPLLQFRSRLPRPAVPRPSRSAMWLVESSIPRTVCGSVV